MTQNIFIISDTHFGHEKTCTEFKRNDGTPLRPFANADEMDAAIIENWNSVVRDADLILHLGDVCFNGARYDAIMPQLKGRKYLIRGNHDRLSEKRYRAHFARIYGIYIRDRFAFTHVPIHPENGTRWLGNIHGHTHANNMSDPYYFNASVENIGFKPVSFGVVKEAYRLRTEVGLMPLYRIAIVKWNGGHGALLCNVCRTIISTGFNHEDTEHRCKRCPDKLPEIDQ